MPIFRTILLFFKKNLRSYILLSRPFPTHFYVAEKAKRREGCKDTPNSRGNAGVTASIAQPPTAIYCGHNVRLQVAFEHDSTRHFPLKSL